MGGLAIGLIVLGWLSGVTVSAGGRLANGSPCFNDTTLRFLVFELVGTTGLSVYGAQRVLRAEEGRTKLDLGLATAAGTVALPVASLATNHWACRAGLIGSGENEEDAAAPAPRDRPLLAAVRAEDGTTNVLLGHTWTF